MIPNSAPHHGWTLGRSHCDYLSSTVSFPSLRDSTFDIRHSIFVLDASTRHLPLATCHSPLATRHFFLEDLPNTDG